MGKDPKYTPPKDSGPSEAKSKEEKIREQGYGWILRNKLTGDEIRTVAHYNPEIEIRTETYELIIFTWEEKDNSTGDIQWGS